MKTHTLKHLARFICTIAVLLTLGHIFLEIQQFIHTAQIRNSLTLFLLIRHATFSALAIMSLYIALRSRGSTGRYLFSIFLALFVLNDNWIYKPLLHWAYVLLYDLGDTLALVLFVATMQNFPQKLTDQDIFAVYKTTRISRSLVWLTRSQNLAVYFTIALYLLQIALSFARIGVLVVELAITIISFCYMYVSFRIDKDTSRSTVLWLFWGVLLAIIIQLFQVLIMLFDPGNHTVLWQILTLLLYASVLASVFMSIFFADSFDTGFIITRTIVDGALFLTVVLIYNVTEHYLLHLLNEHFEINDALTSSIFSGLMVLLISPLHHKLTHFLDTKLKHKHPDHRSSSTQPSLVVK